MNKKTDICGLEHVKWLDNGVRRYLQNPRKMFKPYIKEGDTVLDIGCGPGAFIPALAEMVGSSGKVIAIDLQEEMLALTRKKVASAGYTSRVTVHKCSAESLDISQQADFILTFFMMHETPDPLHLITEICHSLKQGGTYYLAEPKFHVTKRQFLDVIQMCNKKGLVLIKERGIVSRTAVFRKN